MIFADAAAAASARPVTFVTSKTWAALRDTLQADAVEFADSARFTGKPGSFLLLPGGALFGLENADDADIDLFRPGRLARLLPEGTWVFANAPHDLRLATLSFALMAYRFTRYRKSDGGGPRLVCPASLDRAAIEAQVAAVTLARDLINTPANDMGPAELEAAARDLAAAHGARVAVTTGDALLAANLPLIHAVGRASSRAPRLIDLQWGRESDPKVTLVGKGVCFDSGGLDIKPDSAMLLMKKDMGGAATVLALAHMVMQAKLPVRLRVLIPAVENSVGGDAFRPMDIYPSRKGLSVEIGNTDAEGRLVLADALAVADEDEPDLLIDLGTLTGAARVALGPDLPPFYCMDDTLAADIAACARAENDPLWRLPLWSPYDAMLDSKNADLNNVASGGFAGSIICALFLRRFVERAKQWIHVDIYAWNPSEKSGRPEGGECQAARALFRLLSQRYR